MEEYFLAGFIKEASNPSVTEVDQADIAEATGESMLETIGEVGLEGAATGLGAMSGVDHFKKYVPDFAKGRAGKITAGLIGGIGTNLVAKKGIEYLKSIKNKKQEEAIRNARK